MYPITVAGIINERGLCHVYYNQDRYKPVELLNQVHDSIVFQIPLSVPWEEHASILLGIRDSLETPLEWRGRKFVIPAELQLGKNMKDMEDIEWADEQTLANRLKTNWENNGK